MEPTSTLVERTYRRMTLMQRMIERLEVDTAKVVCADNGITFRAVVGRCRGCGQAAQCGQWLDGQGGAADPARFCPNAKTFQAFRHQ